MTSPITCHVLDSTLGKPGAGIDVQLELLDGEQSTSGRVVGSGQTNADGRLPTLLPPTHTLLPSQIYRLTFYTSPYFASFEPPRPTFYPRVEITFSMPSTQAEVQRHYHVPLLISPYSYTTYRGS
ncbi:unnamed protein product [Jaminaea pallidilutea]